MLLLLLLLLVLLIAIIVVYVVMAFVVPKIIKDQVGKAPIDKLVVVYDATVLGFSEFGVNIRLHFKVLGTKLPLRFLTAGLAVPPTITISHIPDPVHPSMSYEIARVQLSDEITVTGEGDAEIKQSNVVVTILHAGNVRTLLRSVALKKSLKGVFIKLNLEATIQVLGHVLWENLPLEKIIDVHDAQVRKHMNLEKYLEEQRIEKEKRKEIAVKKETETEAACTDENSATSEPISEPLHSLTTTLPASSSSSSAIRLSRTTTLIPRSPEDALLPGLKLTRLPLDSTLTSLTSGLLLSFTKPPPLGLRLSAVTFDVHLNGSIVASGYVSGIHVHDRSMLVRIGVEIVPAVVSRPVRGVLSSMRGVLRGALNGTVSGLLGGEWGSGAAVIKLANVSVVDALGGKVVWLNEVLEALEIEHDLDAVRRLGGAVKGGLSDVAMSVLSLLQGVFSIGGAPIN